MQKILVTVLTLFSFQSLAQSPVADRLSSGFDAGMAYTKDHYNPSLTYYQLLNFGERKLFSLGWTMRLGAFYGDNLNYYTAPARLTRGKSGFSALSAPILRENIDTIRYDYVTVTSLNAGIRAQINLGWIELGASADLLGFTFGKRRTVRYQSSTGQFRGDSTTTLPFTGANARQQEARPTKLNARLLGDNDLGTLTTEVFARVYVSQRIAIKGGYQWLTTETAVSNRDVVADNNRFRHRVGMGYVAITFPLFY